MSSFKDFFAFEEMIESLFIGLCVFLQEVNFMGGRSSCFGHVDVVGQFSDWNVLFLDLSLKES